MSGLSQQALGEDLPGNSDVEEYLRLALQHYKAETRDHETKTSTLEKQVFNLKNKVKTLETQKTEFERKNQQLTKELQKLRKEFEILKEANDKLVGFRKSIAESLQLNEVPEVLFAPQLENNPPTLSTLSSDEAVPTKEAARRPQVDKAAMPHDLLQFIDKVSQTEYKNAFKELAFDLNEKRITKEELQKRCKQLFAPRPDLYHQLMQVFQPRQSAEMTKVSNKVPC